MPQIGLRGVAMLCQAQVLTLPVVTVPSRTPACVSPSSTVGLSLVALSLAGLGSPFCTVDESICGSRAPVSISLVQHRLCRDTAPGFPEPICPCCWVPIVWPCWLRSCANLSSLLPCLHCTHWDSPTSKEKEAQVWSPTCLQPTIQMELQPSTTLAIWEVPVYSPKHGKSLRV
jgi:hypothetical protein